jgi:hypothetical protein
MITIFWKAASFFRASELCGIGDMEIGRGYEGVQSVQANRK